MESILTSVKKLLGMTEEYTVFDTDLIMHINSVFMILNQMGVGPKDAFCITDATATWSDFTGERTDLAAVKSYVALKVRLFDPPQSSVMMDAIKNLISELEWRLYVACDKEAEE
jgi:hypothetical protein